MQQLVPLRATHTLINFNLFMTARSVRSYVARVNKVYVCVLYTCHSSCKIGFSDTSQEKPYLFSKC